MEPDPRFVRAEGEAASGPLTADDLGPCDFCGRPPERLGADRDDSGESETGMVWFAQCHCGSSVLAETREELLRKWQKSSSDPVTDLPPLETARTVKTRFVPGEPMPPVEPHSRSQEKRVRTLRGGRASDGATAPAAEPAPSEWAELRRLRAAVVEAMKPNDNADGEWLAKDQGGCVWMICGPKYKSRPSRMIVSNVDVDGFTAEQADANNKAIAQYLVGLFNASPRLVDAAEANATLAAELAEARGKLDAIRAASVIHTYSGGKVRSVAVVDNEAFAAALAEPPAPAGQAKDQNEQENT